MASNAIRLIPAVIGGDREKRTGVVLAKSIPAKKFGIKTGEPIGMALRKCPDLFMAKPDFRLYEENSKKFMDICREYAPVVEKASVDECYLDMSGTHRIYPDPVALAHTIKDRIRNELGFTVNVGIGDNKLLAKMASDFEKPDKVHTLFLSELPRKMWPLPVGDLFTVGSSTADKLWVDFEYRHYLLDRNKKRAGYLFYWADFSSYPVFDKEDDIPAIRLPVRTEHYTIEEVLTSFIEAISCYFAWISNIIVDEFTPDENDVEEILQAYLSARSNDTVYV